MATYTVQWKYKSGFGGPFAAGDVVEMAAELAAAINRDSPGVLVPYAPPNTEPPETQQPADRMVKRAKKRETL